MRILLADSQSRVRFALRSLLEEQPGLVVVAEAADCPALLAQVKAACPDLVLLDWDLPGMGGLDLLAALHRLCPGLHVIALSSRPEAEQEALAAGARAFVSKAGPPEPLLAAIQSVQELYERGSGAESLAQSKGGAYTD
jgi:two-component system response regulator FimZ (fimbrial Z protein)